MVSFQKRKNFRVTVRLYDFYNGTRMFNKIILCCFQSLYIFMETRFLGNAVIIYQSFVINIRLESLGSKYE